MVHSSIEGPPGPTTQTSLWAHGKRRRKAWNLPQLPAKTAHPDRLDWDHFRDLYHPDGRRHNLEAIVAYGDYKRTPRLPAGSEAVPLNDVVSANADSIGEWEDDGGPSRDPARGGCAR